MAAPLPTPSSPALTAPAPKKQPIPFGRYLLLDRINIGGMAEVWRGKSFGAGGFERLVAIKRILPNIAEDDEFIAMFQDEAKISVQLTHANICQIYELNRIAQSLYIAMEYVPGKDLRSIFDRARKKGEPPPVPLVCYVVGKLCEGLDYAHRKKDSYGRDLNIVHRDVSPQNVLISFEGEVKVIDFGIAKAAGKVTKTQAGILKGKFGYMSPEQIRGLPLDRRSDVFAIGVCLYELLTGERLFVGDSDFAVLEKVRKAEVLPPSTYNRRIPEALEKIVLRALAKDVNARYQYASELADDLQRFLITSDSIFSRKDLMQYMKSTFAEEVDREKARLAEYAEVKAPEGLLAAMDALHAPPASSAPAGNGAVGSGGAVVVRPAGPPIPKLTAAAPQLEVHADDGATLLVDGNEYFLGGPPPLPTSPRATVTSTVPSTPASAPTSVPSAQEAAPSPPPRPPTVLPEPVTDPALDAAPRLTATPPQPVHRPLSAEETFIPPRPSQGPPVLTPSPPPPDEVSAPPGEEPRAGRTLPAAEPLPLFVTGHQKRSSGRFWALGAAALAVAAVLIFLAVREPPQGMLLLELTPPEVRGHARVNINGSDVGTPPSWPFLHRVPAGKVVVMVTADGFRPSVSTVNILRGSEGTPFTLALQRTAGTARLVVLPDPDDAEVRLNGTSVKRAGVHGFWAGEVPVGTDQQVEVRRGGFHPYISSVLAHTTEDALQVRAVLEPFEYAVRVTSQPPGAAVFSGERELGVTPVTGHVPATASALTLRKRCFETAQVPLKLPETPGAPLPVRVVLRRAPNCR
jgi:eukaryotic-like serine/threonine-protein kinase